MSIEQRFDVPVIAAMALREKQIQQNYRPIISVHKWFARRPGTLFRGLVLAEFGKDPLKNAFFRANNFYGLRIADSFMGGGTPLIEANRVGCDVDGCDVNPMAAWIVREEVEHIDMPAYERAADALTAALRSEIGRYYRTSCPHYGDEDVPVESFLWLKQLDCEACRMPFDLFPGYLLAKNRRHPKNVLVCPTCGDLNEVRSDLDTYVDAVFGCLTFEFLVMPKGDGFVEFPVFENGYEALKRATASFREVTPGTVAAVVFETPILLIVLRCMLGFTPPEWT